LNIEQVINQLQLLQQLQIFYYFWWVWSLEWKPNKKRTCSEGPKNGYLAS